MSGSNIFERVSQFLSKKKEWYELPTILAVPHLIRMRNELREKNSTTPRNRPFRNAIPLSRCRRTSRNRELPTGHITTLAVR
jgi:hypothetical protein